MKQESTSVSNKIDILEHTIGMNKSKKTLRMKSKRSKEKSEIGLTDNKDKSVELIDKGILHVYHLLSEISTL